MHACEDANVPRTLTPNIRSNRFIGVYSTLVATWNATSSSATAVESVGQVLLNLLSDIDTLLATNENYLLSTWISDARQWAHNDASYASYLEYNARNQLTLWGPDGEINDYASKQWAGLVGTYYVQRWEAFVAYLVKIKTTQVPYNATLVADQMLAIGEKWDGLTFGKSKGDIEGTRGDALSVAETLVYRWA